MLKICTPSSLICIYVFIPITFSISFHATAQGADPIPATLIGTWQVEEVHTNMQASRTPHYGWNDPALRWRIFRLKEDAISNNTPEASATTCSTPKLTSKLVSVDDFLRVNLGGYGADTERSPAMDYKLDFGMNTSVNILLVRCAGNKVWNSILDPRYPETPSATYGSWLLLTSRDRLMLRWFDETILVLSKIASGARPIPSFSCTKAANATENAICRSFELAGFDQSVAFAYQLAMQDVERIRSDAIELRREQQAWLRNRNNCGGNEGCLRVMMRDRIEKLRQSLTR